MSSLSTKSTASTSKSTTENEESTTFSLNKLKSYLPFASTDISNYRTKKSKQLLNSIDPEVGFQMSLNSNDKQSGNDAAASSFSNSIPELHVKVIGARHLPSMIGLKSVAGYTIKVKLFPGSERYDTSIQISSWPTFNEIFKFPMEQPSKSSFKLRNEPPNNAFDNKSISLPERLFKGHFLVLTVFALLELPSDSKLSLKNKITKLKLKSAILRINEKQTDKPSNNKKDDKDAHNLTTSETRRNLGSITCFLDPKMFDQNQRNSNYGTQEMWLPLKDVSVTPSTISSTSVTSSSKAQIEMILQISNESIETIGNNDALAANRRDSNINNDQPSKNNHRTIKNTKNNNLCFLKITTARLRCSIKVKEELEYLDGPIYIKTSVFEHDILSSAWKSDQFLPSLSIRWDPKSSTIIIPITTETNLDSFSIKITIATKTKLKKKIILGSLFISSKATNLKYEHWKNMIGNKGVPCAMWHSFE